MKKRIPKRIISLIPMVLLVGVMLISVLSSCNSMMKAMTTERVKKLGVYDKYIPEDQLVTLLMPMHYIVNTFDGKEVKWKGTGMVSTASMIKIPAGSHAITYKYKYQSGGVTAYGRTAIRRN